MIVSVISKRYATILRCGVAYVALQISCAADPAGTTLLDLVDGSPAQHTEDVVFEGEVTDEALARLLALPPVTDSGTRGEFLAPTAGERFNADAVPSFGWRADLAFLEAPRGRSGVRAHRSWSSAPVAFGLQTVRAHGPPFNGSGFLLEFSTHDRSVVLRVFTSRTTYTPDAEAWSRLVAAVGPISVVLKAAVFENNQVAFDGGPFAGTRVTFEVAR